MRGNMEIHVCVANLFSTELHYVFIYVVYGQLVCRNHIFIYQALVEMSEITPAIQ